MAASFCEDASQNEAAEWISEEDALADPICRRRRLGGVGVLSTNSEQ